MPIENQVLAIWAASNGFTDDVPVEDVRTFEAELLKFIENSHPGLLQSIREKKNLTDEIKSNLQQALKDFKDIWNERSSDVGSGASLEVTAPEPASDLVPAEV